MSVYLYFEDKELCPNEIEVNGSKEMSAVNSVVTSLNQLDNPCITSVDEILKNELNASCNRYEDNKNNVLIHTDLLVIDSFESCSGKESTQKILYDLILKRVQLKKPVILLLNGTLNRIKTISFELYSLVNDLFTFFP